MSETQKEEMILALEIEIKELRLTLEDEEETLTLGQANHLLLRLERAENKLMELKNG